MGNQRSEKLVYAALPSNGGRSSPPALSALKVSRSALRALYSSCVFAVFSAARNTPSWRSCSALIAANRFGLLCLSCARSFHFIFPYSLMVNSLDGLACETDGELLGGSNLRRSARPLRTGVRVVSAFVHGAPEPTRPARANEGIEARQNEAGGYLPTVRVELSLVDSAPRAARGRRSLDEDLQARVSILA